MTDRKDYPPVFVKPGETVRSEWDNGSVEFIGIWPEEVVTFCAQYMRLTELEEKPGLVTKASLAHQRRAVMRAWKDLPGSLKTKILEQTRRGGIWLPEAGE